MGNSSSQMAPSQVPTQDVPVTSQPSTQLPALDGTQEEQPQTLKRVASDMDARVEDTVRKAKRARGKDSSRAHRKSVPQHTLGYAIQPSQEVLDTQEELQADAGASDGEAQEGAGDDEAVEEPAVLLPGKATNKVGAKASETHNKKKRLPWLEDNIEPANDHPTKPEVKRATKTSKTQTKRRRLPWLSDDVEQTVDDVNAPPAPLEDVDVNTLDDPVSQLAKQKKRKPKDIELERLQKDVEDFAPELESTPKPKPVVKRQKRAKDVDKAETIDEQPEPEDEAEGAPASAKPQKRSKLAEGQAKTAPTTNASKINAVTSKSKGKKPSKPAVASESVDPAGTTVPEAATQLVRARQPAADLDGAMDDVNEEEAVSDPEQNAPAEGACEDPPADSIPTPPESPDDPDAQVDDDGQQEELPGVDADEEGNAQEAVTDVSAGAAKDATAPESRKLPRSEKLKRKVEKGDADDYEPESADNNESESADNYQPESAVKPRSKKLKKASPDEKKQKPATSDEKKKQQQKVSKNEKKQKKASSDDDKLPTKERGEVQGTWSKEERARADEVFEDVVRVTAVPDWELKANIIDWKNPTPHLQQFKDALYEAFPKRSLKSIARFCQRRYNAYDRGDWTAEQDQLLREAYELFPDQWTTISDSVGRFWEDCRGRWRDVLSRSESKAETGPWSREEELKLAKVVQECRALVLKETEDEEVRENHEKADALISWKVVAEKLGNTRSAKRCREKWARIKHQDLSANAAPGATQPIKSNPKKVPSGVREAETDYLQCKAGDVYDILTEICSAVPDVMKLFEHETTFWSVVAIRNPESKFKSALRRKALSTAIEDYPCKAVSEAETLAGKAKGAKDRMELLERKGRIELTRAYRGKVKKAAVKKMKKTDAEDVASEEGGEAPAKKKEKKTKSKKPKKLADEAIDGDDADQGTAREVKEKASKPKIAKNRTSAPKPKTTTESNKYKSADLVIESDDEGEEAGDDVEVAHPPADADEEDEDVAEADGERARQQTEELQSLGDEPPNLSPSTFIDVLKGGKRVRGGKKGGKGVKVKNREGLKAFGLRRASGGRS